MVNISNALYAPVTEGMWQQHELWDGTYTFDDWADAIEILAVKKYNKMMIAQNITESITRK